MGVSAFTRRLFSTGSIFLNSDSESELLADESSSLHDPGDGGRNGFFSYVSPNGGLIGYSGGSMAPGFGPSFDGVSPGGFGGLFGGPPGGFGGFGGGPAGFGGPGGF